MLRLLWIEGRGREREKESEGKRGRKRDEGERETEGEIQMRHPVLQKKLLCCCLQRGKTPEWQGAALHPSNCPKCQWNIGFHCCFDCGISSGKKNGFLICHRNSSANENGKLILHKGTLVKL